MRGVLVTVGLVLALAPAAQADVTIGSALPPPSGGTEVCAPGCTYSSIAIAGRQTVAPSRGIITRWRIRGGPAVPVRLVVLRRPAGPGGPAELAGRSAQVTPAADDVMSTFDVDVRIPILAGEYIGIELAANVQAGYFADVATSARDKWMPPVGPGVSLSPTGSSVGREVLANADVEPDVDGDGLGDTTQDADDDGDGVADTADVCPAAAGPAPRGCPIVASPPPVPNQPPTARFRTPRSGTGVGPTVRIELEAADDHGLPEVNVFDDDGTICVLRAAPYACTWRPTGADVGRATLLASAVDSGGLSSLAIVRVRVNRFAAKVTKKAKRSGGRLKVSGRLVLPAVVTRAQGCRGRVTVRVRTARRTAPLTPRCTYSVRLKVRTGRPHVRFGGNPVIAPT
jgi:Bacterial Ig domain